MKSSIKAVNIAAALFVTLGVIAAPPQKGKPGKPGKPAVRDQQAPRPVKHTVRKTEVNSAAYQPARSEHMLVFTKRGAILFDQRVVGDREVRDRIKMLTLTVRCPASSSVMKTVSISNGLTMSSHFSAKLASKISAANAPCLLKRCTVPSGKNPPNGIR